MEFVFLCSSIHPLIYVSHTREMLCSILKPLFLLIVNFFIMEKLTPRCTWSHGTKA
ncbi:hypothetical protein Golob_012387, partial [Gossypium lobatum]|nr:hypothetical protein [Gossypium lobatum]